MNTRHTLRLVHGNRQSFARPYASNRMKDGRLTVYEGSTPVPTGESICTPDVADWTNDTVHEVIQAMQGCIGAEVAPRSVNSGLTRDTGELYIRVGDFYYRTRRVVFIDDAIPASVREYVLLKWTSYYAFVGRLASGPKRRFWQHVHRSGLLTHHAPWPQDWTVAEAQRAVNALERFMRERHEGAVTLCLSKEAVRASLSWRDKRECRSLTVNAMVGSLAARMLIGNDIDLPPAVLAYLDSTFRVH